MSNNDQGKISIGVSMAPLVISQKEAKIGEIIHLTLIEGLTFDGIVWRSNGNDVLVLQNNTVVFTEPGFYIPVILGYPQHKSYGITVSE